ncbi:MAG TPA: vWA domain-containing protein [Clostridia bacterium]|nr:vWA domain-containing protein [Clostridia bacterium]
MESQGIKYSVDLVLCIDATGSMGNIIGRVKENAVKFHSDLYERMKKKDKEIDSLRVKVITFRDFYVDGEHSMLESRFYSLPQEEKDFADFVSKVYANGGGDEPENGLEAVAAAIKSDWTKIGEKKRQVIVVWTDASTHPLEKDASAKPGNYPAGLPKTFDELTDLWDGQSSPMSLSAKRLILFTPDADCWTTMATYWQNTLHCPSKAGNGLGEMEYGTMFDVIVNSI